MDTATPAWRGRRPEFKERHIAVIADGYRRGATKTASANAAGFCQETIRLRLIEGAKDVEAGEDTINARLFLAVEEAEARCEFDKLDAINKAVDGYDTKIVRETVKSSLRTYKTKDADGNTIEKVITTTMTHPDGRVEEVPVQFEERTTETVSGREFDPRMAVEYLKRRRKKDYGDRTEITGEEGGPIQFQKVDLTDEERANRLNDIRERARQRAMERGSGNGG